MGRQGTAEHTDAKAKDDAAHDKLSKIIGCRGQDGAKHKAEASDEHGHSTAKLPAKHQQNSPPQYHSVCWASHRTMSRAARDSM